jgi:hypothetical protein
MTVRTICFLSAKRYPTEVSTKSFERCQLCAKLKVPKIVIKLTCCCAAAIPTPLHTTMKFTSLALLAIVGSVSAGKPQLSVRSHRRLRFRVSSIAIPSQTNLPSCCCYCCCCRRRRRRRRRCCGLSPPCTPTFIILPLEGCSCPLQTQIADLGQGWTIQGT